MVGHIWRQIWSSRLNAQQRRDFKRRFPQLHALTGWCVTLLRRGVGAAAATAAAAVSGLLHLKVKRKNVGNGINDASGDRRFKSYSYVSVVWVNAQALNRSAHLTLQRPDAHVLLVELLLLESDALQEVVDASVLRLEHQLRRRWRTTHVQPSGFANDRGVHTCETCKTRLLNALHLK